MPDRARDAGHANQEHDGPGGEQETQKPDQKAHYRSSVPTLCAEIRGVYPNTAIPPSELPPRGRTIKGPADNIDRFRRPAVDFLYRCRCGQTRAWATGWQAFQPAITQMRTGLFICRVRQLPAAWLKMHQLPAPSIRPSGSASFPTPGAQGHP